MNGFCYLNNVVYQAIIFPKENIKEIIWKFHRLDGN